MDGPPKGGEIAAAVQKLQLGMAGLPSGMKVEHLKSRLREATREKDPDTESWKKVVSVMQVAFWEGYILEALMWTTIFLIPKGGESTEA